MEKQKKKKAYGETYFLMVLSPNTKRLLRKVAEKYETSMSFYAKEILIKKLLNDCKELNIPTDDRAEPVPDDNISFDGLLPNKLDFQVYEYDDLDEDDKK